MIKGAKEYLDSIAKTHLCAEHATPVVVAWHAEENSYVLRCGHGEYPEEVTRQKSLTEMHKQGEDLPEPIKHNVQKAIERRQAARASGPVATSMGGVSAVDLATGASLTLGQLQALIDYANKYGLDPYRSHVVVMHGKPYISVDGYYYHANRSGVKYSMTGRPLTDDELKHMGYQENDYGYKCTLRIPATDQTFEGYGFVTTAEVTATAEGKPYQFRYPVVHDKPGNMVVKRSEWQVLRRAFPIGEGEEVEKP